jgi:general secretion pathway protein L
MLAEFLGWWLRQWRALLPRALCRPDALLVIEVVAGQTIALQPRRRGPDHARGLFALDDPAGRASLRAATGRRRLPAVLRVPADWVLQRRITLPLAAERGLANLLRYEMDRLTPFAADEVHFAWSVAARDRAHQRLDLVLRLVPRASVQPVLAALAESALVPRWLEATGAAVRIPLCPPLHRSVVRRRATAAIIAVLLLGAVALPFARQAAAERAIARRIAALRPAVAEAEMLRHHLAAHPPGEAEFAAEQARDGDTLQVLAALTDLLADDTYLTELRLQAGRLTLEGESAAAARLIPVLAASRLLRSPAFAAPITRLPNASVELFSIRAEIAPVEGAQ